MLTNPGKKTDFLITAILKDALIEEVKGDHADLFRRTLGGHPSLYVMCPGYFSYNCWILGRKKCEDGT